ncbi:peptidylprolyl isomerase [Halodesulfovibrio marinisediminis]|uniref:SurA N-terminal domain-containing protein n=1 Tax=Halodesulfovibrio marinisediminis DSM 17456 TaxID=1121457 RepID=A0A1N6DZA9_9BACT|nr:peptidylprolyl isomerase [Halodesulfovibrio marinisediminis]SIN76109.1 SurA N-terminal domain-containing protein [Halodesulfovibrio marinisediminis DSM 17456]
MRRIIVLLLLLLVVVGCTQHPEEKGVVARVNGEPIYLKELEARYDLNNLGWVSGVVPSVEALSAEYGNVLSELVVYKLVAAALEKEGLSVSAEDVQKEEAAIRADYPDDLFERTLTEEYIDISVWRLFLKRHLEMKMFFNDVLRSTVSLTYQEAERYYKDNLSEFYIPERVHVLLVRGNDITGVQRASLLLEQAEDWKTVVGTLSSDITVRELKLRKDRFPIQWSATLQQLSPKSSSNISTTAYGFEQLVLLAVVPEKLLGPSQAYSVIERVLIDQKMNEAFVKWLEKEVASSKIEVTPLLSEKMSGKVSQIVMSGSPKKLEEAEEEPYREPESEVGKKSDP